jgi:hypothetical protein
MTTIGDKTSRYLDAEEISIECDPQFLAEMGNQEVSTATATVPTLAGRDISHNADVAINGRNSLIRPGLEEFAADDFLHGQDDAVLASNADSCAAVLDCLYGVLDL